MSYSNEKSDPHMSFEDKVVIEPRLLRIASEVADLADVIINVQSWGNQLSPSSAPQLVIIKRKATSAEGTGVLFEYITHRPGISSVGGKQLARLQQSFPDGDGISVINDVVEQRSDSSFVRHRRSNFISDTRNESKPAIKPASARTIVAMARLAAYHITKDNIPG
ncbi:MAG: hypothetical protein AAB541_00715 [Patescibacteria group bacterium]